MAAPMMQLSSRFIARRIYATVILGIGAVIALLATGRPPIEAALVVALVIAMVAWDSRNAVELAIDGETLSWKRWRGGWTRHRLADIRQVRMNPRTGWYVYLPGQTVRLAITGWRDEQGTDRDTDLAQLLTRHSGQGDGFAPVDDRLQGP